VPTSAPPDVRWELFQGLALPTSPIAGPRVVDGPVRAGYAHTPTGALIAAAQISARALLTPEEGWRVVVARQLVPNPGRDAFVRLLGALDTDEPPSVPYAQLAGFRFLAYDRQVAVISTVTRSANGVLHAGTDTLRWVEGDWKLEKPPNGLQQPQVVRDLSGYVAWSGVG
jgi:hypothetical protein